jgi:trimeric autotransporter adhesin
VTDAAGKAQSGTIGITFSLYEEQQGGVALWSETQNVMLDEQGRYTVLLGSAQAAGLPLDLFVSGKARWLGVTPQVAGVGEQPRVPLVGVPYALKAADADTLGGLPASAFLHAAGVTAPQTGELIAHSETAAAVSPSTACASVTSDGTATANSLAVFTTNCNIEASTVVESGGKVGIGTSLPTTTLDVKGTSTLDGDVILSAEGAATALGGFRSYPLSLDASSFNSSTSAAVTQVFEWQAEPVGNDTATPSASMNLLYASGTATPANTGFSVASNGVVTFAAGQTFPGTVTSVASGAGLTGGPIKSTGTLSIANGGVTNTMIANPSVTVTAGTALTGGGKVALGASTTLGLNTGLVPLLASANTFTMPQTINSVLNFPNTTSAGAQGAIFFNGIPFLHDYGPLDEFNVPGYATNVFLGAGAGNFTMSTSSYYGGLNVGVGEAALLNNTMGNQNVAVGYLALFSNTTGAWNTANGSEALLNNTTGGYNTAEGYNAMVSNTTGANNTAQGSHAMYDNTTGGNDTAAGYSALFNNTTGASNTANGYEALYNNTTSDNNTATGALALYSSATGISNTADGYKALYSTTATNNTAAGASALENATTGNGNIGIGYQAGYNVTTGSNNIEIGNTGTSSDNGVIYIGTQGTQSATFIAGISGVNVSGAQVVVTSSGQLGVTSSSRRYKEDIQDMADASDGLMKLRPVTFRYKQAFPDGSKPLEYGLIAEEVAEVYPDMVVRSANGQIETVKYQELAPMLLNELQKQNGAMAAQAEQIRSQQEQIRELAARLARLEAR